MPKRDPEDVLNDIEDSETDDEIERILAMSPEERLRNLEARDVDVKSLHAKADALHARIHESAAGRTQASAAVLPMPARRPLRRRWAISLIAAAMGVVLWVTLRGGTDQVAAGYHAAAARLRNEAYADCEASRWRDCAQKLDEAKEIDPNGESEPRVVAARKATRDALGH